VDLAKAGPGLRWIFPMDEWWHWDDPVINVWGIGCAWYFPAVIWCGVVLAAAESARRLENYRRAMVGCRMACLFPFPPLGVLCVARLMDKEVQYEFEISEMRREGVDWEALEDEQLAAEEAAEEEEEEEDEDEDQEEEQEETPRKRRR